MNTFAVTHGEIEISWNDQYMKFGVVRYRERPTDVWQRLGYLHGIAFHPGRHEHTRFKMQDSQGVPVKTNYHDTEMTAERCAIILWKLFFPEALPLIKHVTGIISDARSEVFRGVYEDELREGL